MKTITQIKNNNDTKLDPNVSSAGGATRTQLTEKSVPNSTFSLTYPPSSARDTSNTSNTPVWTVSATSCCVCWVGEIVSSIPAIQAIQAIQAIHIII